MSEVVEISCSVGMIRSEAHLADHQRPAHQRLRLRESLTPDKGNTTAIVSKALYGMGGIARRGRRSNMPGPIVKTTPLYSSPKPILRKNCVATLRASPGRCGWPKPKKPRRRCG